MHLTSLKAYLALLIFAFTLLWPAGVNGLLALDNNIYLLQKCDVAQGQSAEFISIKTSWQFKLPENSHFGELCEQCLTNQAMALSADFDLPRIQVVDVYHLALKVESPFYFSFTSPPIRAPPSLLQFG